ncbi:Crp/Fnr family transcriptional regulator [Winogradskyella sp. PC D3.3]
MNDYLKSFNLFTDLEINDFLKLSQTILLKKGDLYINNNEVCNSIAFVKSGIFRSYYFSNNDEEITYCFTFPSNLLMAYSSLITGNKSEENIQALSDAEIISISKQAIESLAEENVKWLKFLKIVAEKEYVELEKWIFNHQKDKAQRRYSDLIKKQPEFIQQIPLQYIASYLGITQRHLSRIRSLISF